jgi:molybdate transport system substrate-binding protein
MVMVRGLFLNMMVMFLIACGHTGTEKATIRIFSAAGARTAVEEICAQFDPQNQYNIELNVASTGLLARQLSNGVTGDIFISANKQWIDYLLEKKIISDKGIRILGTNSLVAIQKIDAPGSAPVFTREFEISKHLKGRIAIGNPDYVPVGKYTKMVFDSLKWFPQIEDKMILAKDVSSVLHYVELGECEWGIVYYTEAIRSKKVKIIAEIPTQLHPPIHFYMAKIENNNIPGEELSRSFTEQSGKEIFIKNGFRVEN